MIKGKIQKNKGFTIMETLVAIFILLISITGPLAFSQSGLRAAFVSRDQITAFYLGQDAMEYVKNVRDNNMIKTIKNSAAHPASEWLNGLEDCEGGNGCTIDTTTDTTSIKSCGTDPGCGDEYPLKKDGNGFFGFNGTDSIFTRIVKINKIASAEDIEAEVTVTIRWNTHEAIGQREIVVRENIFNWAGF